MTTAAFLVSNEPRSHTLTYSRQSRFGGGGGGAWGWGWGAIFGF